jgi:hypothetical protein
MMKKRRIRIKPRFWVILAVFVFVVLLGVGLLLKHTFPRVYAFLTAGR